MAFTVVAMFEDRRGGLLAARDLTDRSFDPADIAILSGGKTGDPTVLDPTEPQKSSVTAGASIGAAVGALGGIVGSLMALTIPGVGPLLAAGPFIAAVAGGSTGAIAGAIIGGLIDMGIPEHHVHSFLQGIRHGGTLLVLHQRDHNPDDRQRADEAAMVLRRRNPMELEEKVATEIAASPDNRSEYSGGVLVIRAIAMDPRIGESSGPTLSDRR